MAVTFAIYYGMTVIDLTDHTASIFLQESSYVPVVATPTGDGSIPPYVTEVVPVGINATSYNGYATLMQDLADMQKHVAEYWVDQQQAVPVYLQCKLDNETGTRQALIKRIDFSFDLRNWQEWLYQQCGTSVPPSNLFGTILIERHPYWERTSTRTFPNATPAAAASVAYDYTTTADVVGDVPARINALELRSGSATYLEDFWLGIRSEGKHGAVGVTSFVRVWEAEDGTNLDAEVADVVDATASGGDNVTVTPVAGGTDWDDGSFHDVFQITLQNAGYSAAGPPAYADADGRFQWLLRANASAGTWQVRMHTGWIGYELQTHDPVTVSSTSWTYSEMGVASIPLRNKQAIEIAQVTAVQDFRWGIKISAKRTAGAGNLLIDCLCPIPVDEGFLKIDNAYVDNTNDVWFGEGPKDVHQAFGYLVGRLDYEAETFRLPPGDGRIICVYARPSAVSVLTDTVEFADATNTTNSYTERWAALRGAE